MSNFMLYKAQLAQIQLKYDLSSMLEFNEQTDISSKELIYPEYPSVILRFPHKPHIVLMAHSVG
ncbi:hypothetical protein M422DRAFT_267143 [Sphaerobolus stellatus SS14]|uniref:Uncharacterized protein n=1 Tax=Sphaerobolus stellatus (strain SS14) TaxID=990650 RepID=A0A0C9U9J3_SPHS4|nr:hypothetical protein M422DRAFT_267143 [Sphaerobolus stellatus SS14]